MPSPLTYRRVTCHQCWKGLDEVVWPSCILLSCCSSMCLVSARKHTLQKWSNPALRKELQLMPKSTNKGVLFHDISPNAALDFTLFNNYTQIIKLLEQGRYRLQHCLSNKPSTLSASSNLSIIKLICHKFYFLDQQA